MAIGASCSFNQCGLALATQLRRLQRRTSNESPVLPGHLSPSFTGSLDCSDVQGKLIHMLGAGEKLQTPAARLGRGLLRNHEQREPLGRRQPQRRAWSVRTVPRAPRGIVAPRDTCIRGRGSCVAAHLLDRLRCLPVACSQDERIPARATLFTQCAEVEIWVEQGTRLLSSIGCEQ